MEVINQANKLIPSCLRICDTMFTQMIVLQTNSKDNSGSIPVHIENDDHVNAILTLGDIAVGGGSTVYYDGTNRKDVGKEYLNIPFEHGRLQIGYFDHVYHGVSCWKGDRVTVSLSLQRKILKHFVLYGSKYYDQFKEKGYPSKDFIAL
jgi:hypothetical protein